MTTGLRESKYLHLGTSYLCSSKVKMHSSQKGIQVAMHAYRSQLAWTSKSSCCKTAVMAATETARVLPPRRCRAWGLGAVQRTGSCLWRVTMTPPRVAPARKGGHPIDGRAEASGGDLVDDVIMSWSPIDVGGRVAVIRCSERIVCGAPLWWRRRKFDVEKCRGLVSSTCRLATSSWRKKSLVFL